MGCGGSCINPALFRFQLSLHTTHPQLGYKAPLPPAFQAGITIYRKYFIAALILPSALAVLKKAVRFQSFLHENQVWHFSGLGSAESRAPWGAGTVAPMWKTGERTGVDTPLPAGESFRTNVGMLETANLGNCIMSPRGTQKRKETILSILL